MASETSAISERPAEGIKHVPQDAAARQAVRAAAAEVAVAIDRVRPLSREDLEQQGKVVLERLELPDKFLGFAMLAVSNEFWRDTFAAIPLERRLFLLPHCLANRGACQGVYDSVGLHCAGCGNCEIDGLERYAKQLGYSVIVAEGTGSVIMKVLDGESDAILGVACLDSLEASFHRVAELGVPHIALPLLRNGCVDTRAELDEIRLLLAARSSAAARAPRSYIPLLREATRMFHEPTFSELLGTPARSDGDANDGWATVEAAALDWLKQGGKRLRPFVTLAAYAVARHGMAMLTSGDCAEQIPLPVRRVALAIEALHKASLAHDDIEDNDEFRYGRPTLHQTHGVAQAINIGDYFIGLGYRLVAGESSALGPECVGDILHRLSTAHLELCRGQGADLEWQNCPSAVPRPMDLLLVYAMKTAPAFEVAIYAGLRAAGVDVDPSVLRRFATFLGEAYQIRNDLDDWQDNPDNRRRRGLDARAGRAAILRAFASESSISEALPNTTDLPAVRVRELYGKAGAFHKAEQLFAKLRTRAMRAADDFPTAALQELMRFLVRMILPESVEREAPGR